MTTTDPRIDAHLAGLPDAQREGLQRVRDRIGRSVPHATETISYGIPGFRLEGHLLISFAGWKRFSSIYPVPAAFAEAHAAELAGFGRTKGGLQFTADHPLPDRLLDALIRARLDDLAAGRR